MSKGRPGGNPELVQYQFSTEREEPCTAKLTLRIPPSQYEKLKQLPQWQEKVREAISTLLEREQGQLDSAPTENAVAAEPARAAGKRGKTPANGTGERTQEDQTLNARAKGKGKG